MNKKNKLTLLDYIRSDLARHEASFLEALKRPGFQAAALHRISHALYEKGVPILPGLLKVMGLMLYGIEIAPNASIGPGLMICHTTGIIIGASAKAGSGLTLFSGVVIGYLHDNKLLAEIGDDVIIYHGALLLGNVKVGDGARIAPYAVVRSDVEPGAVAK